jgi:sporulation integral membrane protein YtvI
MIIESLYNGGFCMEHNWKQAENIAKKILICAVLCGAAALLIYLLPKIIVLLLPFLTAYIIKIIATPLRSLFEKIKLPKALSAVLSIILVAVVLFAVVGVIVYKIGYEIYGFSSSIPALCDAVSSAFLRARNTLNDLPKLLPFDISPYLDNISDSINDAAISLSSSVVEVITRSAIGFAKNIPSFLIAVVFSILAAFFMLSDEKNIKSGVKKMLGTSLSEKLRAIKADLSGALLAYVKAQGILMSITFTEIFIGLSILGIKYSFLFAILIAIVDAIPVLGTGTILLPWAVVNLIMGNYSLAIGLLIIYAVCIVVRQFLEPKIISSQIGMHPLLTLVAMYVGFRLFGILGMILGPVVTLIAKNFIERLDIHLIK